MGLKHDLWLSRKTLAGFAAIGAAWASYFALMPVIKAGVGASDGSYGLVVLGASLGAVAAMWLAPLAQRLAGGWAMPLSIFMIGAGMLGAGAAPALAWLGVALLIASAGSGISDVLVNARIAEIEAQTGRSLMNLNHGLYSFVYAGAALSVGFLREAGFSQVMILSFLLVILAGLGLVTLGVKPSPEEQEAPAPAGLPTALIWLAGAVVFFGFLAEASAEGWSALHLERTLGGDAKEGALGPALLGLTMGFGRLSGHALAQFMRERILLTAACLVSAVGMIIAGLAPTVGVALAGFALAGLGISVVVPLALALVGRAVPQSLRLAAISRVSVLGYGAFFCGPPLMGLVSEGLGLRVSFLTIAAILCVVAFTLIPALTRRTG
jgi:hypothetical protein